MNCLARFGGRFLFLGVVAFAWQGITLLPGQTVELNNLTNSTNRDLGVNANTSYAQAFTTGSSADGFNISSILLQEYIVDADPGLTLSISSDSSSLPGSQLYTLTEANPSATGYGAFQWNPSTTITLAGSTVYWVVLSSTDIPSQAVGWTGTGDPTYSSADGWSLDTSRFAYASFAPWRAAAGSSGGNTTLMLSIKTLVVPEPATWTLVLLGLAGLCIFRSRLLVR